MTEQFFFVFSAICLALHLHTTNSREHGTGGTSDMVLGHCIQSGCSFKAGLKAIHKGRLGEL
jgi:hypothetical protein